MAYTLMYFFDIAYDSVHVDALGSLVVVVVFCFSDWLETHSVWFSRDFNLFCYGDLSDPVHPSVSPDLALAQWSLASIWLILLFLGLASGFPSLVLWAVFSITLFSSFWFSIPYHSFPSLIFTFRWGLSIFVFLSIALMPTHSASFDGFITP